MDNYMSTFSAGVHKPKQSRSSSKRSHDGCQTCKDRHLKCDETRPRCVRCTKRGLECSGYPRPFKWSYKHQQGPLGARPRRATSETTHARRQTQEQQQRLHQEVQSGDNAVEEWSPTYLLGLDCLESLDQAFGGNEGLDSMDMMEIADWPWDFGLDTSADPGVGVTPYQSHGGTISDQPSSHPRPSLTPIPQDPAGTADSALRLTDNWFDEVCPAWSGFDSGVNMNRRLAETLWRESTAVFKSLQSMSASFLAARLPQMRRPALSLLKAATHCIQAELEELHRRPHLEAVPTGVLFALLCVGTTVCWLDVRRAGWPFLQDAKRLLRRTLQQDGNVSEDDAAVLDFFHKSLSHWEMLIAFIYDPEPEKEGDEPPLRPPRQADFHSGETVFDLTPHPWTGVSSLSSSLFAESMRISRTYRRRATQPLGTINVWSAIREVQEAKRLEDQLLQLQFTSPPLTQDTHDTRTPLLHLVYVAEAYHLASLLQLYITFPALVSLRISQGPHQSVTRGVPWYTWITPLTLRLAEVLERLPPDSGSRFLHPLLYVCAATGLRYASATEQEDGSSSHGGVSLPPLRPMESILDYLSLLEDPIEGRAGDGVSVSQLALDVSKARGLILRRLGVLKESLHPGPVRVAEELVRAIWAAYDEEPQGCTDVYWIDVMEKKDLRTLFG